MKNVFVGIFLFTQVQLFAQPYNFVFISDSLKKKILAKTNSIFDRYEKTSVPFSAVKKQIIACLDKDSVSRDCLAKVNTFIDSCLSNREAESDLKEFRDYIDSLAASNNPKVERPQAEMPIETTSYSSESESFSYRKIALFSLLGILTLLLFITRIYYRRYRIEILKKEKAKENLVGLAKTLYPNNTISISDGLVEITESLRDHVLRYIQQIQAKGATDNSKPFNQTKSDLLSKGDEIQKSPTMTWEINNDNDTTSNAKSSIVNGDEVLKEEFYLNCPYLEAETAFFDNSPQDPNVSILAFFRFKYLTTETAEFSINESQLDMIKSNPKETIAAACEFEKLNANSKGIDKSQSKPGKAVLSNDRWRVVEKAKLKFI